LSGEEKVCLRILFTGQAARFIEEYEASKADSLQRKMMVCYLYGQ